MTTRAPSSEPEQDLHDPEDVDGWRVNGSGGLGTASPPGSDCYAVELANGSLWASVDGVTEIPLTVVAALLRRGGWTVEAPAPAPAQTRMRRVGAPEPATDPSLSWVQQRIVAQFISKESMRTMPQLLESVAGCISWAALNAEVIALSHAVDGARFHIGNNRGGRNGWIGRGGIYGLCTKVTEGGL